MLTIYNLFTSVENGRVERRSIEEKKEEKSIPLIIASEIANERPKTANPP